MRVLVVEDDPKIASFIQKGLETEGHAVDVARTGLDALSRATAVLYELIVLDVMLPGMDGREVLRRLRSEGCTVPVIIVTARGEVEERVAGLDAGADDYLTKPFSFVELTARIRALQRRTGGAFERLLRAGDLTLDTVRHVASRAGVAIDLTPCEYQLLDYFMRHPRETLTRAMLADRVWGIDFDTGSNVIDVYVTYLRKKLGGGQSTIRTVRGVGYVFDLPEPARA